MDLDENKGTTIGCLGVLIAIIAVIANISQILDWLGIKPKEKAPTGNSSSIAESIDIDSEDDDSIEDNENSEVDAVAPPPDYQPKLVNLSDLSPFSVSDNNGGFVARMINDNIGNPHTNALLNHDNNSSITYNKYYLNKKYIEFSGTVFLTENGKSVSRDIYIEISGDAVSLGTFILTDGTLPQEFLIDVTNVEVLEIKAFTEMDYWEYVGIDATLTPKPE